MFVKFTMIYALAMIINCQTSSVSSQIFGLDFAKADRVVVIKSDRRMILMNGHSVLKVYQVALGRYPKGHKQFRGDARTPEGEYILDLKIRNSHFYRAIRINYPNAQDTEMAKLECKDPGGKIMIHGLPNTMSAERVGHPTLDWTQGCIAVTNRQMDEIWRLVDIGTPIEIHP